MKFIHTADWQLGKPFAWIRDPHKRSLAREARIEAIDRIGAAARDAGAAFVLVAGDLFDSPSADRATVSAACGAIGRLDMPVLVIPGNHDHGGPGSLWVQDFFLREWNALAPNMTVLTEREPLELDVAIILPCPLLHRTTSEDPTAWLRASDLYARLPSEKPRVVLAHGSTQSFGAQEYDDLEGEDEGAVPASFIDLDRIPQDEVDYIALGDWHGTQQAGPKAWYAGTLEPDRFPKGADNDPGNVLLVEAGRNQAPRVERIRTARLRWRELVFDFAHDSALDRLEERLAAVLNGPGSTEDLLRLTLTGSLSIEARNRLDRILESLQARVLELRLADNTRIAPTEEEVRELCGQGTDPLIGRVATRLAELAQGQGDEAAVARVALRELYAACGAGTRA